MQRPSPVFILEWQYNNLDNNNQNGTTNFTSLPLTIAYETIIHNVTYTYINTYTYMNKLNSLLHY